MLSVRCAGFSPVGSISEWAALPTCRTEGRCSQMAAPPLDHRCGPHATRSRHSEGFKRCRGAVCPSIQSALFHPPAESSVSGSGRRLEILAVHQVTAPNDSTSAVDQGPTAFTKAIVASLFSF